MIRRIVHIDQDKCNGCGACARACHEGAIDMVDGKAKLMREHYCDGLGDCLPACPTGAITLDRKSTPPGTGPIPAAPARPSASWPTKSPPPRHPAGRRRAS